MNLKLAIILTARIYCGQAEGENEVIWKVRYHPMHWGLKGPRHPPLCVRRRRTVSLQRRLAVGISSFVKMLLQM
jgi:hypothetical protein